MGRGGPGTREAPQPQGSESVGRAHADDTVASTRSRKRTLAARGDSSTALASRISATSSGCPATPGVERAVAGSAGAAARELGSADLDSASGQADDVGRDTTGAGAREPSSGPSRLCPICRERSRAPVLSPSATRNVNVSTYCRPCTLAYVRARRKGLSADWVSEQLRQGTPVHLVARMKAAGQAAKRGKQHLGSGSLPGDATPAAEQSSALDTGTAEGSVATAGRREAEASEPRQVQPDLERNASCPAAGFNAPAPQQQPLCSAGTSAACAVCRQRAPATGSACCARCKAALQQALRPGRLTASGSDLETARSPDEDSRSGHEATHRAELSAGTGTDGTLASPRSGAPQAAGPTLDHGPATSVQEWKRWQAGPGASPRCADVHAELRASAELAGEHPGAALTHGATPVGQSQQQQRERRAADASAQADTGGIARASGSGLDGGHSDAGNLKRKETPDSDTPTTKRHTASRGETEEQAATPEPARRGAAADVDVAQAAPEAATGQQSGRTGPPTRKASRRAELVIAALLAGSGQLPESHGGRRRDARTSGPCHGEPGTSQPSSTQPPSPHHRLCPMCRTRERPVAGLGEGKSYCHPCDLAFLRARRRGKTAGWVREQLDAGVPVDEIARGPHTNSCSHLPESSTFSETPTPPAGRPAAFPAAPFMMMQEARAAEHTGEAAQRGTVPGSEPHANPEQQRQLPQADTGEPPVQAHHSRSKDPQHAGSRVLTGVDEQVRTAPMSASTLQQRAAHDLHAAPAPLPPMASESSRWFNQTCDLLLSAAAAIEEEVQEEPMAGEWPVSQRAVMGKSDRVRKLAGASEAGRGHTGQRRAGPPAALEPEPGPRCVICKTREAVAHDRDSYCRICRMAHLQAQRDGRYGKRTREPQVPKARLDEIARSLDTAPRDTCSRPVNPMRPGHDSTSGDTEPEVVSRGAEAGETGGERRMRPVTATGLRGSTMGPEAAADQETPRSAAQVSGNVRDGAAMPEWPRAYKKIRASERSSSRSGGGGAGEGGAPTSKQQPPRPDSSLDQQHHQSQRRQQNESPGPSPRNLQQSQQQQQRHQSTVPHAMFAQPGLLPGPVMTPGMQTGRPFIYQGFQLGRAYPGGQATILDPIQLNPALLQKPQAFAAGRAGPVTLLSPRGQQWFSDGGGGKPAVPALVLPEMHGARATSAAAQEASKRDREGQDPARRAWQQGMLGDVRLTAPQLASMIAGGSLDPSGALDNTGRTSPSDHGAGTGGLINALIAQATKSGQKRPPSPHRLDHLDPSHVRSPDGGHAAPGSRSHLDPAQGAGSAFLGGDPNRSGSLDQRGGATAAAGAGGTGLDPEALAAEQRSGEAWSGLDSHVQRGSDRGEMRTAEKQSSAAAHEGGDGWAVEGHSQWTGPSGTHSRPPRQESLEAGRKRGPCSMCRVGPRQKGTYCFPCSLAISRAYRKGENASWVRTQLNNGVPIDVIGRTVPLGDRTVTSLSTIERSGDAAGPAGQQQEQHSQRDRSGAGGTISGPSGPGDTLKSPAWDSSEVAAHRSAPVLDHAALVQAAQKAGGELRLGGGGGVSVSDALRKYIAVHADAGSVSPSAQAALQALSEHGSPQDTSRRWQARGQEGLPPPLGHHQGEPQQQRQQQQLSHQQQQQQQMRYMGGPANEFNPAAVAAQKLLQAFGTRGGGEGGSRGAEGAPARLAAETGLSPASLMTHLGAATGAASHAAPASEAKPEAATATESAGDIRLADIARVLLRLKKLDTPQGNMLEYVRARPNVAELVINVLCDSEDSLGSGSELDMGAGGSGDSDKPARLPAEAQAAFEGVRLNVQRTLARIDSDPVAIVNGAERALHNMLSMLHCITTLRARRPATFEVQTYFDCIMAWGRGLVALVRTQTRSLVPEVTSTASTSGEAVTTELPEPLCKMLTVLDHMEIGGDPMSEGHASCTLLHALWRQVARALPKLAWAICLADDVHKLRKLLGLTYDADRQPAKAPHIVLQEFVAACIGKRCGEG